MESFNELLEVYAREITILRGVRPNTIRAYTKAIQTFSKWLGSRSLLEAQRQDFLNWRESESPKRKAGGMQLLISGVRSFYAWATETKRLPSNPCPTMIVHKKPIDPHVPSTEQFLRMRSLVQFDLRKSALIELLAGSGMRIDAALAVRPDQFCFAGPSGIVTDWRSANGTFGIEDEQPVRVRDFVRVDPDHCKGFRVGTIPITPCAAVAMQRYLKAYPKRPNQRIFSWSYASAYRVVRTVGDYVGIRISPHSFRHFYGCLMYWRSLDSKERDTVWVRDAMGHSSIAVTDTYFRLARVVVRSDVDWHDVVWHGWRRNISTKPYVA